MQVGESIPSSLESSRQESPLREQKLTVTHLLLQVSHTYEDFMDLSMGLPQEEPRERKVSNTSLERIRTRHEHELTCFSSSLPSFL